MTTEDNTPTPMLHRNLLREALDKYNAQYESRRQRSITAAAKAAAKAPEWAQEIWKLQQAHDRFWRLVLDTMNFAHTKGFSLDPSTYAGYDLRRGRKVVLRGRPIFVIVEHLGAQHIWKDV